VLCTNPRPAAFSAQVAHFKRPLPLVQPPSPPADCISSSSASHHHPCPPPPLVVPLVTAPFTALLSRAGPREPRCPGAVVGALGAAPPSPEPSCIVPRRCRRHPLDEPPCQSKPLPCWWVGTLLTSPSCASPPQSHRRPSHQPPPPEFSALPVRSASSHHPVVPVGSQGNGFARHAHRTPSVLAMKTPSASAPCGAATGRAAHARTMPGVCPGARWPHAAAVRLGPGQALSGARLGRG
jgi:hypothetical protein